jgi:hypothetical protein
MRNPGEEFNRKWREANDRVRLAEEKLGKAWEDYAAGRSGAPPEELLQLVSQLRREADTELQQLMANMQISRQTPG